MKKVARAPHKRVKVSARVRNIGAEILSGLKGAIEFERGRGSAVFKAAAISSRNARIPVAREFTAREIVALRKRLHLSQTVFAQALNVSPETAKAWEHGRFSPSGSVNRLLEIATHHPRVLLGGIEYTRLKPSNSRVAESRRVVAKIASKSRE